MTADLTEGRRDCGGVRWTFRDDPGEITDCNCGFCRRMGALWAYGSVLDIVMPEGTEGHGRCPVNRRLTDPRLVLGRPIERLGGASTWRSLGVGKKAKIPLLPL